MAAAAAAVDDRDIARITIVTSWMATPFVLAVLVSFAKPMFVDRYLIVCLPAAALLTAASLDALIDRFGAVVGAVALAVVLAYNGLWLVDWYRGNPAKEDFRSAVAFACSQAGDSGFVTAAPDWLVPGADYYRSGSCGADTITDSVFVVVREQDEDQVSPPDGWPAASVKRFDGGIHVLTFRR